MFQADRMAEQCVRWPRGETEQSGLEELKILIWLEPEEGAWGWVGLKYGAWQVER